jgi:hypothetical protein
MIKPRDGPHRGGGSNGLEVGHPMRCPRTRPLMPDDLFLIQFILSYHIYLLILCIPDIIVQSKIVQFDSNRNLKLHQTP